MLSKPKSYKDMDKMKSSTAQKNSNSNSGTSESNQIQFEKELVWCIQQLETIISSGKLDEKQLLKRTRTLNTLTSTSAPMSRKKQLMQLSFGDYRLKMAEDEEKHAH